MNAINTKRGSHITIARAGPERLNQSAENEEMRQNESAETAMPDEDRG